MLLRRFAPITLALVWITLPTPKTLGAESGPGRIVEVAYPGSDKPGELIFPVTYRVWIPDGVPRLRGLIVHQHGCGKGAGDGGKTAADDLHWQALARKWDCALLGPSIRQEDGQNCRLWCDPRNGSRARFLQALDDLAEKSSHPELKTVPWCLWGHSGGAFWSSLMMISDPQRVVAVWLRSGTGFTAWEKGEIPRPEISDSVYRIPVMCNPGRKEETDKRFQAAWTGATGMFKAYRSQGAPIGLAPDPRTAHECGDSRYLAIPFFDACLAARLPDKGSSTSELKSIDISKGWLATPLSESASAPGDYHGDHASAVWLPDERVARAWEEYVKTGAVGDSTPPPLPTRVIAAGKGATSVELTWNAEADFESGLRGFLIRRNGKEIAQLPESPIGKFGRPLFQGMSYHDTPEAPLPALRFLDQAAPEGVLPRYEVIAVNGIGLPSQPAVSANAGR